MAPPSAAPVLLGVVAGTTQVGYYRVTGTGTSNPNSNSWDVAFRPEGSKKAGDLIYLFDMSRGVEVLRLKKGTKAAASMKAVTAPSLRSTRYAAKATSSLVNTGDPNRFICPLFDY